MQSNLQVPFLNFQNKTLYLENVNLNTLAKKHGTPLYVYSQSALTQAWQEWQVEQNDRPVQLCYAVKACSNLSVLRHFASLGAYFDTVSQGEIQRVITAGVSADRIVFSGVGKSATEIQYALEQEIYCFNIESMAELERVSSIAKSLNKLAPISFRVNPNVDSKTHPYISTALKTSKFGIAIDDAVSAYQYAAQLPNIRIVGVDCHIGSQITQLSPFKDTTDKMIELVLQLQEAGIVLEHIDLGGGLGVRYQDEVIPKAREVVQQALDCLKSKGLSHTLMFEPGRSLVANASVLLTTVEYLKSAETKNFVVVDAAMNDFIRPALYQAWVNIVNVQEIPESPETLVDVVGPVCESGDWLAQDRMLSAKSGDILAILSTGAYGFSMSSNYNTRTRAAEIMVNSDQDTVIRKRETLEMMWQLEL